MNVLIACEESQRVCTEFRKRGHNAYSCDLLPCSGGHPEWHILDDVTPIINGKFNFKTQDGKMHSITGNWDLIIAHPPCTRLCNSGQRWLYWGDDKYKQNKRDEQKRAIDFFMLFVNAGCKKLQLKIQWASCQHYTENRIAYIIRMILKVKQKSKKRVYG